MPKPLGVYPLHQAFFANPPVTEVPAATNPTISDRSVVGIHSLIVGDVTIDDDVFVGFYNVLRADSSKPYYIGPRCNIQDFVVMHCHPKQYITVNRRKLGVYLEADVSVLNHAAIHGPLFVGRNTFIGQHVNIYGAIIGHDCVVMHGATITNHVRIGEGRFIAPGQVVASQAEAEKLPEVPQEFKKLNPEIVDFYYRVGKSYHEHTPLTV